MATADPARARYVKLGLDLAHARRRRWSYDDTSSIQGEMRRVAPYEVMAAWWAPVQLLVGETGRLAHGRGFVEHLTMDASEFLDRAEALYAAAPVLDLLLKNIKSAGNAFFDSVYLARIRSLDFFPDSESKVDDAWIAKLAESRNFGKLLWLNLYGQSCSVAALQHLAASEFLPNLAWVGGGGARSTPDVNPVPKEDESGVYAHGENHLATSLRAEFGPRKWLSAAWDSREQPHPEALM